HHVPCGVPRLRVHFDYSRCTECGRRKVIAASCNYCGSPPPDAERALPRPRYEARLGFVDAVESGLRPETIRLEHDLDLEDALALVRCARAEFGAAGEMRDAHRCFGLFVHSM